MGVRPSLNNTNVTLLTEAKVTRFITNASGNEISYVEVEHKGESKQFSANIFVVSANAVNSAILLLKSANDKHPNGLANASGQAGRNFMKHNNIAMMSITLKKNPTIFQKTLAINDYYLGAADFKFPMGCVQLLGK